MQTNLEHSYKNNDMQIKVILLTIVWEVITERIEQL